MEPYRSHFPHANLILPQTQQVARQVLVLPTGTAIGPDEISGVCDIIRTAVGQAAAVKMALLADEQNLAAASRVAPATRTAPDLPGAADSLSVPPQDSESLGAH